MDIIKDFFEAVKKEETMVLATAGLKGVSMRKVSPVLFDNKILFFTDCSSKKYKQLLENKNCCIQVNDFFAECTAEFLGKTMLEKNKKYRENYSKKFKDAFNENDAFGGFGSDFVLLSLKKISGWKIQNENTKNVQMMPFEISVD